MDVYIIIEIEYWYQWEYETIKKRSNNLLNQISNKFSEVKALYVEKSPSAIESAVYNKPALYFSFLSYYKDLDNTCKELDGKILYAEKETRNDLLLEKEKYLTEMIVILDRMIILFPMKTILLTLAGIA